MFSKSFSVLFILVLVSVLFSCGNQKSENKTTVTSETRDTVIQDKTKLAPKEEIRYSVGMGAIADLNYTGEGMLIGRVTKGKAGEKAGLLKGDILLEMDGETITNMVVYTRALAKYQKGDIAKILVKRNEQLMEMFVEF